MTNIKKISLLVWAALFSNFTYAEIIELDAYNSDHCRQQLLKSTDELPVIAIYGDFYEDSESFLKKFEELAKQHPERDFFKWNQDEDVFHTSQSLCLQQLGVIMPASLMMMGVMTDDNSNSSFMVNLRSDWAGQMTLEDMNKFIDVSGPELKKVMFVQKDLRAKVTPKKNK